MTKIENFLEENSIFKSIKESGSIEYKILNYLKDIENGFFVEAGAYDGIFQSNTKILEDLGWRGLLVEPSYERAIECYNNRSKESIIFNGALVSFDYKEDTIMGNFGSPISSISGVGKSTPARTLTYLLNTLGVNHVDLFSLDTEGYELEALNGVDFEKITFNYLMIEVNSNIYSLDQINSFLIDKGYVNISNISNFSKNENPSWPGNHQDYLYKNINL